MVRRASRAGHGRSTMRPAGLGIRSVSKVGDNPPRGIRRTPPGPSASRATATSSKGRMSVADDLAGLMALAGDHQGRRRGRNSGDCGGDGGAAGRRSRRPAAPRRGSRPGISAGFSLRGVVVGDIDEVGKLRRRPRPHQRALAPGRGRPPGPRKNDGEPVFQRGGRKRGEDARQRVRRMGVIDKDRGRRVALSPTSLHAPRHAGKARQRPAVAASEGVSGRYDEAQRGQHVSSPGIRRPAGSFRTCGRSPKRSCRDAFARTGAAAGPRMRSSAPAVRP